MKVFGIIGAGVMGSDIAYSAALSGFEVLIYDINKSTTEASLDRIRKRLRKRHDHNQLGGKKVDTILSNIAYIHDMAALSKCDIILECVVEDPQIKKEVFRQIDSIASPGSILASNTSSISITEIASATNRPESVIGIHFLIPAHIMRLVEIIPGLCTTRETFEMAKAVVKKMGKEYVESRDFPGFMLNRMLLPMVNEAIYLIYEGAGTVETIDKVMKTGLNLPMGPLALADMIGLDVVLAVAEEMYREYADTKYRPCPLLKKYVMAGYLGKKSGRGFYHYKMAK